MSGYHTRCTGGRLQWWPVQSLPASAICCRLGVRTPKVKVKGEIALKPRAQKFFPEEMKDTVV